MIDAILKIVGWIVGHAINPFVRGRPEAEWAVKEFGVNPYAYIHIKNPGPGAVFIQEVHVDPPMYRVAKDDSAESIADAGFNDLGASVILRQGEERDLPIIDRRDQLGISKDAPSQTVRFAIYWRKTSSTWLWRAPVWLVTSTDHIKQMEDAADPWHGYRTRHKE
jgi:hypothetical protein